MSKTSCHCFVVVLLLLLQVAVVHAAFVYENHVGTTQWKVEVKVDETGCGGGVETEDVPVGNCFDVFAREAGLPMPGGPEIEKIAKPVPKECLSRSFLSIYLSDSALFARIHRCFLSKLRSSMCFFNSGTSHATNRYAPILVAVECHSAPSKVTTIITIAKTRPALRLIQMSVLT